jgi:hypothetical protein
MCSVTDSPVTRDGSTAVGTVQDPRTVRSTPARNRMIPRSDRHGSEVGFGTVAQKVGNMNEEYTI